MKTLLFWIPLQALLFVFFLLLAGCGESPGGSQPGVDASADTSVTPAADVGEEPASDLGSDTGVTPATDVAEGSGTDAGVDELCVAPPGYVLATVADIFSDHSAFHETKVALAGLVVKGGDVCDDTQCPPDDPCCGNCTARYQIEDATGSLGVSPGLVDPVGCIVCDFEPNDYTCAPLDLDSEYLLWGEIYAPDPGMPWAAFRLDGYCL